MAALTVWTYPSAHGAELALHRLEALKLRQRVEVHDAAIAAWPQERLKPKLREVHHLKTSNSLGSAFWALLFGRAFFTEGAQGPDGDEASAPGSLSRYGLGDEFFDAVRVRIVPGCSAIFILAGQRATQRIDDDFRNSEVRVISNELSSRRAHKLHKDFGLRHRRQLRTRVPA